MRRLALISFAFVVVGCAAEGAPSQAGANIRRTSEAIVNGTPSTTANDAVVMLSIGQNELCTGSLIAPNLLLTARHCVANLAYQNNADECGYPTSTMDPTTMTIALGVHADPNQAAATGKKVYIEQDAGCGHDLALLLLDRQVAGAKTAKVNLTKVQLGASASTSGYGEDGLRQGELTNGRYDRTGLKIVFIGPGTYNYQTQQGQTVPFVLYDGEIVTGESTCFGDSGGPLFDSQGLIIGTTWRGVDGNCVDRPSSYSAAASHVALIKQAAADAGFPIQDAPAPPNPPSSGGTTPSNNTPTPTSGTGDNGGGGVDNGGAGGAGDGTGGSGDTGNGSPDSWSRPVLASSGCSTAPGGAGSSPTLALLVVGAAVIGRRGARRRARR